MVIRACEFGKMD